MKFDRDAMLGRWPGWQSARRNGGSAGARRGERLKPMIAPQTTNGAAAEAARTSREYATFFVDGLFFGIDVLQVQEVLRYQEMTRVPLAPAVIEGLINLRGQIVTAVDMRRRLKLRPRAERPDAHEHGGPHQGRRRRQLAGGRNRRCGGGGRGDLRARAG